MAQKEIHYNQLEPKVITVHHENPDKPGTAYCTGQPFAVYKAGSHPKKHKQTCRKCLKVKKEDTQTTLF